MKTPDIHNEVLLATRLMAGDVDAFDVLYTRYFQMVFNNVYSILKDRPGSEDIVQDVFLTLWEKRSTLRRPENIAGWLFVTSSNKSLNVLRKKLRTELKIRSLETLVDIAYIPDDAYVFDQQMAALKNAIDCLSPQQKKVFELCKLEGKTYEETAETLQISKNTVKSHMTLAINNIKDHINRQPSDSVLASFLLTAITFSSF